MTARIGSGVRNPVVGWLFAITVHAALMAAWAWAHAWPSFFGSVFFLALSIVGLVLMCESMELEQ